MLEVIEFYENGDIIVRCVRGQNTFILRGANGMKKIGLLLVLMIVLLAGCGKGDSSEQQKGASASEKSGMESSAPQERSTEESSELIEVSEPGSVMFDNDYCTATLEGFEKDDGWEYGVLFRLKSKTDKKLLISGISTTVNGVSIDPYFYPILSPSEESVNRLKFKQADLKANNIEEVKEIRMKWSASDANNLDNPESFFTYEVLIKP